MGPQAPCPQYWDFMTMVAINTWERERSHVFLTKLLILYWPIRKHPMRDWPGPMRLPGGATWSWSMMHSPLAVAGSCIRMWLELNGGPAMWKGNQMQILRIRQILKHITDGLQNMNIYCQNPYFAGVPPGRGYS